MHLHTRRGQREWCFVCLEAMGVEIWALNSHRKLGNALFLNTFPVYSALLSILSTLVHTAQTLFELFWKKSKYTAAQWRGAPPTG